MPYHAFAAYYDRLTPLALIRFMMPWIADWRKLSELLFIVKR